MSLINHLSGFDLVNKGITKNQATLPELGLKDVCPTGSWLEQKQIQAAIDARRQLISVERIEKSCSLSHAEWRENLMLAEVTQKTGGHWQFMGHNIGKQLFLYPEEALFLMEINCLLLKHNDVKVSIQQAYSLLFMDQISLTQYMVYASLSKLGYKVLRHKDVQPKKNSNDQRKISRDDISMENMNKENATDENKEGNKLGENIPKDHEGDQNKECKESENQSNVLLKSNSDENYSVMEVCPITHDKPDSGLNNVSGATATCMGADEDQLKSNVYRRQIQKIKNRAFKPSDSKMLSKYLKNLPNILNCQTVSVNVPEKEFVPENIAFNKAVYSLNLKALKSKVGRRVSRSYSTSDEGSGSGARRARNASEGSLRVIPEASVNGTGTNASPCDRFMARFPHLRPINFLRPGQMNFFQPNIFYPRLFPNVIAPRIHYFPRWQSLYRPFYFENNPNRFRGGYRKRPRDDAQSFHFDSIKSLAARLKGLVRTGLPQNQSLDALNKLIKTYNSRYKATVRLTADYELVDSPTAVETIELDDEECPKNKKPRLDFSYAENLEDIKRLATRLKELESEGKTTARHRRAFSSLVRTFNKSYNAEIYMNGDYVVSDKRHIVLDSSSDSDCEINEPSASSASGKKLRNPFNVLKRLSEKRTKKFTFSQSTSGENASAMETATRDPYYELLMKTMGENWLPGKEDFGRPEVPTLSAYVYTDNSIYNYAKYHSCDWGNWAELKTAFLNGLEDSALKFVRDECHSIIKTEDCTDMVRVMNKLSIIKRCSDTSKTTLRVAFDVYNRDVQNFRKTCPPVPHFRLLCFDKTTSLPTGEDVAGLYSKYSDGVPMVFAVVHEGSISYLQIKNFNLPMYVSNTNAA